jgi:hypothetical protein
LDRLLDQNNAIFLRSITRKSSLDLNIDLEANIAPKRHGAFFANRLPSREAAMAHVATSWEKFDIKSSALC